jgi:hypothetical protein
MSPRPARAALPLDRLVIIAGVCLLLAALGLTPFAAADPGRPATPVCGSGWQRIPSPNPTDIHSFFNAVAAVAPDDVWAVGGKYNLERQHTLIEHWDGASWSIVRSPSMGGSSVLDAVAAVASDDVWAVGRHGRHRTRVLTEHWDGTSWSIVPSAFLGDLTGITAISPTNVVAVGTRFTHHVDPIAVRWTGSGWVRIPVQTEGKPNPIEFRAVAAADARHIWAVGEASRPNYVWTLAEFSGGDGFSMVHTPTPKRGFDSLLGVTAIAPNDVWAVGTSYNPATFPAKSAHNVTMHWDGASWTLVPAPTRHFAHFEQVATSLRDVDAVSSTEVWAVGYSKGYRNGGRRTTRRRTLVLEWNGQRWSVVPSPNAFDIRNSELRSVSALPDGHVWAVGAANSSTEKAERTLVLERC